MSFRLCVRALALAVAVLALGASTAVASFPGYNGKIAYTDYRQVIGRGAMPEVFTIAPNGSGADVLSDATGSSGDATPAWSANGERLAFVRSGAVWVMNADGTGAHRVSSGYDSDPA